MTTVATMANETAKTIGKIEIIEITFFKFPKILDFWNLYLHIFVNSYKID